MFVFDTHSLVNPRFIINFPTKRHWRGSSKIEDIEAGLKALVEETRRRHLRTIAVPALGCGLGGLDWKVVRPMVEKSFSDVPNVQVLLFEPSGAPEPKKMPVRTHRPGMTIARALFIKLMQQYTELAYRLTLLEIQKLAYFLQEAGEPLRLKYEAGIYGPYAHNLNKVLEILEGHFTRGYGDTQSPDVEIELLPGSFQTADTFLSDRPDSRNRLGKVAKLIEGFETPYGMELLSSVHWVAVHSQSTAKSAEEAVRAVQQWNERKQRMFRPDHIRIAWQRLVELQWVA
jgi:O-acetyl-ADP-ribose deacetylase (regulator of RNase III)